MTSAEMHDEINKLNKLVLSQAEEIKLANEEIENQLDEREKLGKEVLSQAERIEEAQKNFAIMAESYVLADKAITDLQKQIAEKEKTCQYRLDQMVKLQNEIEELKAEKELMLRELKLYLGCSNLIDVKDNIQGLINIHKPTK